MARAKKSSRMVPKAEKRLAGMRSIDEKLSFGSGASVQSYENKIASVRSKLSTYNTLLSQVDAAYNEVLSEEEDLANLSEMMLLGVAARYGKRSSEYEMAGGKRKGERKRRVIKPAAAAAPSEPLV